MLLKYVRIFLSSTVTEGTEPNISIRKVSVLYNYSIYFNTIFTTLKCSKFTGITDDGHGAFHSLRKTTKINSFISFLAISTNRIIV